MDHDNGTGEHNAYAKLYLRSNIRWRSYDGDCCMCSFTASSSSLIMFSHPSKMSGFSVISAWVWRGQNQTFSFDYRLIAWVYNENRDNDAIKDWSTFYGWIYIPCMLQIQTEMRLHIDSIDINLSPGINDSSSIGNDLRLGFLGGLNQRPAIFSVLKVVLPVLNRLLRTKRK